ncbi:hypothetical protein DY000_02041268 [Brassica cretica]|uniref:Ubiquitin-like protease family profile domain-containing protein n=1 Tax=Brassica cretica TaxID=69181 RepID=A0ABQ7BNI3_BRACR|nr:hypothetical protein DY000_02041268 [Brassica cretica]
MTSFRPEIFNRPFLNDIDDPEVRCKDSDYELVFVPEDKFSKLSEWILKPKVLQIGPSKFDAELASRIMGPNEWLKNYDMDAMMYLFREKTSLRRWKPNRVAFMKCMFSNQIITPYGKFDGNRRGYKVDNIISIYCFICPDARPKQEWHDCGAYSLKFIECHLLGLDFSLVNDENIQEARHKITFDLWEAANDEVLQYRKSTFKPPKRAPEKTVELF